MPISSIPSRNNALVADDWERLRNALDAAGVRGSEDLGRFVNNTEYFRASVFDERAAMPVLLELLPTLTDERAIAAVARHLRRSWCRPAAFPALLAAFETWASRAPSSDAAWALGDALATTATPDVLTVLLEIVDNQAYGDARQMVVDALWRFRKDLRVAAALDRLVDDPAVSLHAMSALRRTVGNEAALPRLRHVRDEHPDARVRKQAATAVRRAEKAIR